MIEIHVHEIDLKERILGLVRKLRHALGLCDILHTYKKNFAYKILTWGIGDWV